MRKPIKALILEAAKKPAKSKKPKYDPWEKIEDNHDGDGLKNLLTHLKIKHNGGATFTSSQVKDRVVHADPQDGGLYIYDLRRDSSGNVTHINHVNTHWNTDYTH
jgi:hypothetical protein